MRILKYLKRFAIGLLGFFALLTLLLVIFRKPIERYAVGQLNQYLKVPVNVYKVEFTFWKTFPNFSVRLSEVLVNDYSEEFGTTLDTMFYAKSIDLKANTWKLMGANLSIDAIDVNRAQLNLRVNAKGEVNYDIFKTDSTQTKTDDNFELKLRRILFKNTDFSYSNQITQQQYAADFNRLKFSGNFSNDNYEMWTETHFKLLKFKDKSINLAKNIDINLRTNVVVQSKEKRYEVKDTEIKANNFALNFKMLLDNQYLDLRLSGRDLPIQDVMTYIHQEDAQKLKSMNAQGVLNFDLNLSGETSHENVPDVTADFSVQSGQMKDPSVGLEIKKIQLSGSFMKRKNAPELLTFKEFQLTTMGHHLHGKLDISDFGRPNIAAQVAGSIDLASLHHFFPLPNINNISGILLANGNLRAVITQPGSVNQSVQLKNSLVDLDLKDVAIDSRTDLPKIEHLSGHITANNADLVLSKIIIKTAQSHAECAGNIDNLLGFLEREETLRLNVAAHILKLNLDEFVNHSNNAAASNSSTTVGAFVLPKDISGSVDFLVDQLNFAGHQFSELRGKAQIGRRVIHLPQLKLKHIGSEVAGLLSIEENVSGIIDLKGNVYTDNIDLKRLFAEWNNFEQQNITSDNIRGQAQTRFNFYLPFSMQKGLLKDRMQAEAYVKISNGALVNVAALKEIATSMRDNLMVKTALGKSLAEIEKKMQQLTFATLENTFFIRNAMFEIPKMVIESNILNLTVSGWQHFDERLEYKFEFDFRELKNQVNAKNEFGEIVNDGNSIRLFLKMFGTLSNIQIAWDQAARKAYKKEQREQEKQDIKSMLKSEFGLFKKDTTVQKYVQSTKPKERIEIDFGNENDNDVKDKKSEIDSKFKKMRKKNEAEKEKVVIEFE